MKFLVGFPAPSKRDAEIPHISTGTQVLYKSELQCSFLPLPLAFSLSYFKTMAEGIPSTLGAVFLGTNIAGMYIPFQIALCQ